MSGIEKWSGNMDKDLREKFRQKKGPTKRQKTLAVRRAAFDAERLATAGGFTKPGSNNPK